MLSPVMDRWTGLLFVLGMALAVTMMVVGAHGMRAVVTGAPNGSPASRNAREDTHDE